ncbi:MAG: SAM-dependent DNA methyltransferase [Anaerolineae bacterium]|nr:SAM-dependent DNA methyltransferase [Anaerolineae bacterium]
MNHSQIVSFLWGVADLVRDTFKRGKYQDIILPLTVLRRLDCVLADTKQAVLETNARLYGRLDNLDPQLRKASGFAFYNTSRYDFERLLDDAPHLAANLRNYIAGFSPNMREVLERFDFDNTISKLDEAGLLFLVMERFKTVDLHPNLVDNATMGTIFEELIRKFNEALNENPGEHFTPRDVVHLMVDLLLAGDEARLGRAGVVITVFDPCCGTGGMLTITKNHITQGIRANGQNGTGRDDRLIQEPINPQADVHLFGQEVNPETFAVAKSDLYMKSVDGRDAEGILFGSTLSDDRHAGRNFDYLIANPPYGKDWKRDEAAVKAEHEKGKSGRFAPGLPRISDGQLLFLLHMLAHMKAPDQGGSRLAIIMNGSPLFTGDAGSGESEIRRYILENDWLEALIALPEQMFYNTGIATYVWVVSNRKRPERRGKVMLIDATSFWTPMRKSLGDKRREVPRDKAREIVRLLAEYQEGEFARIFPATHFGFRKITVERPLRLNFQASPERIARLEEERAFQNLATSRKKGQAKRIEAEAGRSQQASIRRLLASLPGELVKERRQFEKLLNKAARAAGVTLNASIKKAILNALSEQDETAAICLDSKGRPEADSRLRDTESVPLGEAVAAFFEREVRPHVPEAWIDQSKRDHKDGQVGLVGYEINFNRYFYQYTPPRPLAEIEADIREIEGEIIRLLSEVTND